MSGVRRLASVRPMLSGAMAEWLPTLGVSWQVVQVPLMTGSWRSSFRLATPAIRIGFVLKIACPRLGGEYPVTGATAADTRRQENRRGRA